MLSSIVGMTDNTTMFEALNPLQQKKPSSRILIVDDHPAIHDIYDLYLEDLKFESLHANDGREALHLVENVSIDLIVSDVEMQFLSGLEFYKKICDKGYKIPILFITGFPQQVLETSFSPELKVELLEKPVEQKAFLEKIKSLLS